MKISEQRGGARPALDLVEEATHLLRHAPLRVLAIDYLGSLPFVIGLLYFWADMSRSAFAAGRCAASALGLALLYAWMKTLQAVSARELRAFVGGEPAPRWSTRRLGRTAMTQTMIHSTAPPVLLIASVILLPYGWVCAFYHNASVLDDEKTDGVRAVVRRAAEQARLWPQQNHVLLTALYFFGLVVWLNIVIFLVMLPHLLHMLLGVETVYTLSGLYLVANTTFLAITCGLTYVAVNPLVKAAYVLRCFYGEARHTGADLRLELRLAARAAAVILALVGATSTKAAVDVSPVGQRPSREGGPPATPWRAGFHPGPGTQSDHLAVEAGTAAWRAGSHPGPGAAISPAVAAPVGSAVDAEELDRAAAEVLQRREYSWRAPRPQPTEQRGMLRNLVGGLQRWKNWWRQQVDNLARRVFRWLRKLFGEDEPRKVSLGSGDRWITATQALLFVLLAAVLCLVVLFAWRVWQRHRRAPPPQPARPVASQPDLEDESVTADELPVDGWLAQARELMAQGDLRLALRALYLASLAQLARQELIALARFKSNREYARELQRRAHAHPDVFAAFTENLSVFEAAWYGVHEVSGEAIERFQANLQRFEPNEQN